MSHRGDGTGDIQPQKGNTMTNDITTTPAFSLVPRNISEATDLAKLIADSDIAPPGFKGRPGNVLVAVQMGLEIGLPPMQAIQNIAVINNRPTIWGDAALAVVQRHPDYVSHTERNSSDAGKAGEGLCKIRRRNRLGEVNETEGKFTMADAKAAGLAGKQGPWSQYPGRMLQLRARAFALRDSFADALKGLSIREEVQDYHNGTAVQTSTPGTEILMPRSKSAPVPKPEAARVIESEPVESNGAPVYRVMTMEQKTSGTGKTYYLVGLERDNTQ